MFNVIYGDTDKLQVGSHYNILKPIHLHNELYLYLFYFY